MRRILVILLTAVPLVIGALHAGIAAPCTHGGTGPSEQSDCPCCDRALLTASLGCSLLCQAAVEAEAAARQPATTAYAVRYTMPGVRYAGIDVQPPLPPPRSLL